MHIGKYLNRRYEKFIPERPEDGFAERSTGIHCKKIKQNMTESRCNKKYRRSAKLHKFGFSAQPGADQSCKDDKEKTVCKLVVIFIGVADKKSEQKVNVR